MDNSLNIDLILDRYQKMPDAQLIAVAQTELDSLTPEAQEIVKAELNKRNLVPGGWVQELQISN